MPEVTVERTRFSCYACGYVYPPSLVKYCPKCFCTDLTFEVYTHEIVPAPVEHIEIKMVAVDVPRSSQEES